MDRPGERADPGSAAAGQPEGGPGGPPVPPVPAIRPGIGPDEASVRAGELGVHPWAVRVMSARGIGDAEAQRRWLDPRLSELRPPVGMLGFHAAVERIADAVERGERIGVFGDYDVDGVTTCAALSTYLRQLGADVIAIAASRDDGYGFGLAGARRLADAGVRLAITGDCGTSDHDAIEWLAQRGVETIVIDHHHVPDRPSPAAVLLNPWQAGDAFEFKGLCSAGVAFYVCGGLRTRLRARGRVGVGAREADPRELLDLVALGTVCDMMPLRAENRVLVVHGLSRMRARPRPAVAALLRAAAIADGGALDETDLGFRLGPRLNAPGRMGSAQPSLDILHAQNLAEAHALAAGIEACNHERKRLQSLALQDALSQLARDPDTATRPALVVADAAWARGVVGIVAAGVVGAHGKPAMAFAIDVADGVARGSARSCDGLDVRLALERCRAHTLRAGGHAAAAGATVRVEALPAFAADFAAAIGSQTRTHDGDPRHWVDGEVEPGELSPDLIEGLRRVGPYGVDFPRPRLCARGAIVLASRRIGAGGEHVRLRVRVGTQELEAVRFSAGPELPAPGSRLDLAFEPALDHYRGRRSIQLLVDQWWPAA